MRAFVQHRPPTPWKVWYLAPNFRAEQPQAGRYRQHWQLGAEVIGIDDPDVDVEIIELLWGFCRDLGLRDVRLLVNSMGDARDARRATARCCSRTGTRTPTLLGAEMERAEANPLRILDSKRPDWSDMLERAPQLGEYLSDASAAHFARVQEGLQALGIPFEIAPRLVRGFDYYTSTVFELASGALDAAQNAIGGGGRYDRLAEEMGGPPAPSIGFGSGIERLLLACDAEGVLPVPAARVDAFVVDLVGIPDTARLLAELRESGLAADRAYGGRSAKKQFTAADRSGARWAVIIGADEVEAGHGRGQGPALRRSRSARCAAKRSRRGCEYGRTKHDHDAIASGRRPARRRHRRVGRDLRLGREPARPRRQGVPRRARRRGRVAGRRRPAVARARGRAPVARRVGRAGRRRRSSARPDGTVNDDLPTGAVEVIAREIEVLSESEPSPFPLDDRVDVDEVLRLRHRYLDLRRAPMQRNLRLRAGDEPRDARGDGRAGLRRGRDADADRVDARKARATSSCRRGCGRGSSTRCRRARSCSSSC